MNPQHAYELTGSSCPTADPVDRRSRRGTSASGGQGRTKSPPTGSTFRKNEPRLRSATNGTRNASHSWRWYRRQRSLPTSKLYADCTIRAHGHSTGAAFRRRANAEFLTPIDSEASRHSTGPELGAPRGGCACALFPHCHVASPCISGTHFGQYRRSLPIGCASTCSVGRIGSTQPTSLSSTVSRTAQKVEWSRHRRAAPGAHAIGDVSYIPHRHRIPTFTASAPVQCPSGRFSLSATCLEETGTPRATYPQSRTPPASVTTGVELSLPAGERRDAFFLAESGQK